MAAAGSTGMKGFARSLVVFVLLALPNYSWGNEALSAIRQTWGELRQAMSAGDGRRAVSLMTPGSKEYFRYVMNLALYAEKAELRVLPAYDSVWAIVLRGISTVEDLRDAEPDEFIGRVIANDQSLRKLFSQNESTVTKAQITGSKASVTIDVRQASADGIRFELVNGRWLFDYTSISDQFSRYVGAERTRNGYTWEQTMSSALFKDPNRPIPEKAFTPPLKRN